MVKDLNKLAKKIITKNQYVSIASADSQGRPWVSPVVYAYDEDWNLYFVSMPSSRHCQNIKTNKNIALAIFDSHQKWGQGVGLQIEGQARVLNLKDSLLASRIYAKRIYPYGGLNTKAALNFIKSMVLKGKKYRIYKIKPNQVYMNDPNSRLDIRVKIDLS